MGTSYRIVSQCEQLVEPKVIATKLDELESVLSTYRADSDITRFNQSEPLKWVAVDRSLVNVVELAEQVSLATNGKFDITVKPLIDLWGFGATVVQKSPTADEIRKVLPLVDYRAIEWRYIQPALRKQQELSIDVSGIGKGYAVDQVAQYLEENRCENYLIDIGGEVRVLGHNPNGTPWQVAIESPDLSGRVQFKLAILEGAVATSGTYRNFRTYEESKVSHLIDPQLGYPIQSHLVSVTVYATTTTQADAICTGLFVMGIEAGLEYAEQKNIAVVFVTFLSEREGLDYQLSTAMEAIIEY
ncbi:MAG: FAD:protein FMN transferase [Gammaproteobacteria bacterium]|nr:FAD:protein FMN transferase [Gammaproteobacteria bacterium]MDE0253017.1 FAD:protein FMN transferase [Gammaproteobacteria bacterium]